jgi:hypothetical protein
MEAMAREAWTDERLDDLNQRVSDGFQRVDVELRDLRRMMFHGFIALTTVNVTCFVGLASLIAF